MVNLHEEKIAYKNLYGKILGYAKHFRNFVEMGVLRSIHTMKENTEDEEMACTFLGYA